jgi:hypothetical protein
VKHKLPQIYAAIVAGIAISYAGVPALADASSSASAHKAMVDDRSEHVMPFDLNRTMHIFRPSSDGGVQTVRVHDGDPKQIALVRSHLRKEALAFARGDFADPAEIHGKTMPGLAQLRAGAHKIVVTYAPTSNGASIRYKTADPTLIAAVHRWFAAQISDHGAHAMMMTH